MYGRVAAVPDSKADSTLARPLAALAGRVIGGRYRMETLLGSGGVGAVYEAVQLDTQTPCALKMLLPNLANASDIALRFEREIKATALLEHSNIVRMIDAVADEGDLYLVMEVLRGRSLADVVVEGALAPRRALVLARQILDALDHAHHRGVIHRDLKPANVVLVQEQAVGGDASPGSAGARSDADASRRSIERVKLVDFGLAKLVGAAAIGDAKLTSAGIVFGTPGYLAPEQASGLPIDGRIDLYATGVMLFEMLTGRAPFRSHDPATLMRMHAHAPAPTLASALPHRAWITPALEALVARALAKDPNDRFASAAEMTAALDGAFLSLD
jgi:serine/threonine-protein kinase